jgi:hypothetical protein
VLDGFADAVGGRTQKCRLPKHPTKPYRLAHDAGSAHGRTALPDKMKQLTPLQVLLALMQRELEAGNAKEAAALARAAAPYVHARVVPKRNSPDLSQLTDAQLESYEGWGMEGEAEDPA